MRERTADHSILSVASNVLSLVAGGLSTRAGGIVHVVRTDAWVGRPASP